jgi:hypothetical protein
MADSSSGTYEGTRRMLQTLLWSSDTAYPLTTTTEI